MEATASTSVTTVLEHHVEESENLVQTQNLIGVPSERAEEGSESIADHLNSYPDSGNDNGTVYGDTGCYEESAEVEETEYVNADDYDGYNEEEETAHDETEACRYYYENDEAIEYEEYEDGENINGEDGADWRGDSDQVSSKAGPENIDVDWSRSPTDADRSHYVYEKCAYFLSGTPSVRYAFLRHLINVFEASFHRFGHHHFGEDLKSEKWRQETLTSYGVDWGAELPWDEVHAVEVKDWVKFVERVLDARLLPEDALADPKTFSRPNLMPANRILQMATYIRNTTFHRDSHVIESQLMTALQIPGVLNDGKKTEELEMIYKIIVDDPPLDAPSSKWVRDILFPPQPEVGTCLEVDTKILGILEEGSFYFAQREKSKVLPWTEPEYGEMQIYACYWESTPEKYWDLEETMKPEECANLDGQFFLHENLRVAVLSLARFLRNSVSHRRAPSERGLCHSAWNAILCFILMGDRVRAIEVESLVEAFLTKVSRANALVRLHNASWNDEPARRDAIVGFCRQQGIEADRLDSPKRDSVPVSPRPSSDMGTRWPEISKSAKGKWDLTDDEESKLWLSAVHRFVFCDSMHEILMRERPVESVEN